MMSFILFSLVAFSPTGDSSFDFYFLEFQQNALPSSHPMNKVIAEGLVESILEADSEEEFREFLFQLRNAWLEEPLRGDDFKRLHRQLERGFEEKLKAAKIKRYLYAGGGALVGAVVAFPVSKFISGQWVSRSLRISLPIGILAGAGAGFLLGHLIHMPEYDFYAEFGLNEDLELEKEKLFGGE